MSTGIHPTFLLLEIGALMWLIGLFLYLWLGR